MRSSFPEHHRRSQPPLPAEPIVRFRAKFFQRVSREEFWSDALSCPFVSEGFSTVLTEFGKASLIVRAWPGAALAGKAVLLVDFRQCPGRLNGTHLAEGVLKRLDDSHH